MTATRIRFAPAVPPLKLRTRKNTADAISERMTTLRKVGSTGASAGSLRPAGDPSSAAFASWRGFLMGGGPAVGRRRRFLAIGNYLQEW